MLVTPVGPHESEENNTGHVSTAAISSCSCLPRVGSAVWFESFSLAVESVEGLASPLPHRVEFKGGKKTTTTPQGEYFGRALSVS